MLRILCIAMFLPSIPAFAEDFEKAFLASLESSKTSYQHLQEESSEMAQDLFLTKYNPKKVKGKGQNIIVAFKPRR